MGMSASLAPFEEIAEGIRAELARQDRLREEALALSRQVIRASALSIRATHRQEFAEAERLRVEASQHLRRLHEIVAACPLFSALGYIADAEKEYAEACLTDALIRERPIPRPEELAVPVAPYLNALGEAAGELRRSILDALRRDLLSPCEARLEAIQQIYDFLVTLDFPEALTGGLRRTTDMVRHVLENTRADLTSALRQRKLQQALEALERRLP
jgi:translin